MQKLGVKQGHRISVLGAGEPGFLAELSRSGADVSTRRRKGSDLIFLGVSTAAEVSMLSALEPHLQRDGAVWVIYPKGRKDIRETDVIVAGVATGFVDNKVVSFSETHTALRFVIPKARR
jgi:hypothetical protein